MSLLSDMEKEINKYTKIVKKWNKIKDLSNEKKSVRDGINNELIVLETQYERVKEAITVLNALIVKNCQEEHLKEMEDYGDDMICLDCGYMYACVFDVMGEIK